MGIRPTYAVNANGSDITGMIGPRLISLVVTDEAGYQSDEATIVLADPAREIELPEKGAELEIWIGYDDSNTLMGLYVVDEIEIATPPRQLTIKAKASPQATGTPSGFVPLQTQFTRSWDAGTTLGDMTRRIAADHGLRAVVDGELDGIVLPHVDQVDESNINLLTRLSRNYDATAKPAGGNLVLARRGQAQTATGEDIPPVLLREADVTRATAKISGRFTHGSVVGTWRDVDAAIDREVTVGSGEPVRRLRHNYTTEDEARAAATAEISRGQRGERKLSIAMPGRPELMAEGLVVMLDFGDGIDGVWAVERVTHTLNKSGYRCAVECENTPAGGGGGGGGANSGQAAREWLAESYPELYDTLTQVGDPLRRDTQARNWLSEAYPGLYETVTEE